MSNATASMTIADIIKECELFEYSQENFSHIKEASELNLIQQAIKSQRFVLENTNVIENASGILTEGYLFESNESELQLLEEKASEKLRGFVDKVVKFFQKQIQRIRAFFTRISTKSKEVNEKIKDILEHLDVAKITTEQIEAINKLVDSAVATSKAPISAKQIDGFRKLPKAFLVISENSIKNKLAAVLVNRKIEVEVSKDNLPMALSAQQCKEFFGSITSPSAVANTKALKEKLDKAQEDNLKKGIVVSNDDAELRELAEYLKKAEETIHGIMIDEKDLDLSKNEQYVALFNDASRAVGDSIQLYSRVINYRSTVVSGLDRILKNKGATPEE